MYPEIVTGVSTVYGPVLNWIRICSPAVDEAVDEELEVEDDVELVLVVDVDDDEDDLVLVLEVVVIDVVLLDVDDLDEVLVVRLDVVDATVPEVVSVKVTGDVDLNCTYTRPFAES